MLKKFQVKNFKGFEAPLLLDFSAREYGFNQNLIQNGLVNKAIVYGKNGTGKSSLGIAIFDITSHLTDKMRMPSSYLLNYRNLNHVEEPVCFSYTFQFGMDEVIYSYQKADQDNLIEETLQINGDVILHYNYFNSEQRYLSPDFISGLTIELIDNKLSVLKYIYRNTPTHLVHPILKKVMKFCDTMLWYRGLSDGNMYSGFTNGGASLTERLYETQKTGEFESFLHKMEINYKLGFLSENGKHELYVYFQNGTKAKFLELASTGTMSLLLFFVWKISAFSQLSFLFIDEFDAFLHYEASETIVTQLNQAVGFQSILTTHNTNLMNNRLMRPDCFYIMTNQKITSFANATSRELREGHNLEKLFISGEFNG